MTRWGRHDLPEGSDLAPGLSWGRILVKYRPVREWYLVLGRLFVVRGWWDTGFSETSTGWWRWRWIRD